MVPVAPVSGSSGPSGFSGSLAPVALVVPVDASGSSKKTIILYIFFKFKPKAYLNQKNNV